MTVTMKELESKVPALQDLNTWYINNAAKAGIATHCFYEKLTVKGVLVVDETSGRLELPGSEPIAIDAHHFSICKPPSREALIYRRVRQIVQGIIDTRETTTWSDAPQPRSTERATERKFSTTPGDRPTRIFLSYRRSAALDHRLAHFLRERLLSAGHEVFIDTGIRVGTAWATEIDQRIAWCDYLIVLLSAEAVDSEMVVGEIRRAHRRRKTVLPVRVRNDDELDYELDSYIGRLQYAKWDEEADSERVLAELAAAIARVTSGPIEFSERPSDTFGIRAPSDRQRPLYTCDPRLLRAPGGTARLRDPLYFSRAPDAEAEAAARRPGETLVIRAPRQMGKSSLAVRYLAACKENGKATAYIDFQLLTENDLAARKNLTSAIASRILDELDLGSLDDDTLPSRDLTSFMEKRVLESISDELAIVFDEADRIFGRPYQGDFFSMLRAWHNRRASHPLWEHLSLALVISTEPHLLIDAAEQSPFNVVMPLQLEPLSRDQLGEMNEFHGAVLNSDELDDLYRLVGGQPYLSRLAFYRLSTGARPTFNEFNESAADPEGPFGEHLRSLLLRLQERPGLLDAMRRAVSQGIIADDDIYHRLLRAGLVRRKGNRVVPTNLLYARYFRDLG
jgi:AAA-like domain/TIR domain